ncbi:MAG TPA: hypothetical protein VGL78_04295 [Solirubrobacteraceae bacterium]|jgi:hypothetical protein
MTSMPTATVEILTVDRHGRRQPVHHAALCSLADAFREVQRFTPAPVGPWVRRRIAAAGGGRFSIGEFDVSVSVLGLSPSSTYTF